MERHNRSYCLFMGAQGQHLAELNHNKQRDMMKHSFFPCKRTRQEHKYQFCPFTWMCRLAQEDTDLLNEIDK